MATMKCGIITIVSAAAEEAYKACAASIELAIENSLGPFSEIFLIPIHTSSDQNRRSEARNSGINEAIGLDCDWVFFLESPDILFVDAFRSITYLVDRYDAIWGLFCEASDVSLIDAKISGDYLRNNSIIENMLRFSDGFSLKTGFFIRLSSPEGDTLKFPLNSNDEVDFYSNIWNSLNCTRGNFILSVIIRDRRRIVLASHDKISEVQSDRELTHDASCHMNLFEINSHQADGRGKELLFTIGTLVNDIIEYEAMLQSFEKKGFSSQNSEYIYINNCDENKYDAYQGLNKIILSSRAKYIIMCHQDVILHADDLNVLIEKINQLNHIDPNWALAGNAGGVSEGVQVTRITDPHGINRSVGAFPCKVTSLDENFLILKRESGVAFSKDLRGFHFYGTDICITADILGYSSYVIDFHLMHLSAGKPNNVFYDAKKQFELKWANALRPRTIQTSVTIVDVDPFVAHEKPWAAAIPPKKHKIFQIFYDENSRQNIAREFIPLDNIQNPQSDWYEFSAIRNTLANLEMNDDCFYGFFSPRFSEKTGITASEVIEIVTSSPVSVDVILLTSKAGDLALHRNIFLQGEAHHPGLVRVSERFFKFLGTPLDLNNLVTSLDNSVASNYIIAKPTFWRKWLNLADAFYEYSEMSDCNNISDLQSKTFYKGERNIELKVFVQERLATFILVTERFNVFVPKYFKNFKMYDNQHRAILNYLENLKDAYNLTSEAAFMNEYDAFRIKNRAALASIIM